MVSEPEWVKDRDRFVADADSARPGHPSLRDHGFPLGPLGQQFAMLTYSLLDARTVEDVLWQVVRATAALVPAAEVVSVTLRGPDGRFHTPVETDPVARELDQLQYRLREGPCLDAARPHGPAMARCEDLRSRAPWPRWAPAAAGRGMGAVVSTALVPAPEPGSTTGALNVYSASPRGFATADLNTLLLLTTHASLAVAGTDAITRAELQEARLHRAVDSRDVIGQAKGIIMARRGVSADEAFAILRRSSQDINVKLVDLAETLALRHIELDPPCPHPWPRRDRWCGACPPPGGYRGSDHDTNYDGTR